MTMQKKGYKILSWNWFQLENNDVQAMIKVHPTYDLMEMALRNGNKLRLAIHSADQRYNGIYTGVIEMPAYVDPTEPIMYIVLYINWQGYPLETGYFTVLGEDNTMPKFMSGFQSKVGECIGCGPYKVTSNTPNRNNMFSRKVGSSENTVYKNWCNTNY